MTRVNNDPGNAGRQFLMTLLDAAVASAIPDLCIPPSLPEPPEPGRLIVLGAGKAAAAMAEAAEHHYRERGLLDRVSGVVATRYGFGRPTDAIEIVEAGHPVPDEGSVAGAQRALELARGAGADDLVLVLLSGGASAIWTAPVAGLNLGRKQDLTRALLACGATISEINCVRRHLSAIKGGRLAAAATPARLITLAISDVPGDLPEAIGSGPTVPDPTTLADAREILDRYRIVPDPAITSALNTAGNETPGPGDGAFDRARFQLVARPADALAAAANACKAEGFDVDVLGDSLEGEARDLARRHAEIALAARGRGQRVAILSGGEVTVTLTGGGSGGPNQEYALALAIALDGADGIVALAADTDGTDGGTGAADDPAGAIVEPGTLARAAALNLNPDTFLRNNDSGGFFRALDDLIVTGPTYTNVNDFRAILVGG